MLSKNPRRILCALATLACLPALPAYNLAYAASPTLQAELAPAIWLDNPQATRFTPGGYLAVRPGFSLGRVLSLQASYALLATPAAGELSGFGVAHFIEGGLRVRPLATLQPEEVSLGGLWADFNLGYVRTGDLDRFGFDAGLGYGFQVAPTFALGPAVRYVQIVQPDRLVGVDPNDGQLLTFGVNLSFGGRGDITEEAEDDEPVATSRPRPVRATPPACPDYDHDAVCDADDRCPTQGGSTLTAGCPADPCTGAPLVMLVQFPYDSAALPIPTARDSEPMDPVLDAVARAIALDPTCRVCIVGNASEEGAASYNKELSGDRANAVKSYLVARGLDGSRLPTRALGESCQVKPETTLALNRRVEFRRLEEGASCPTTCLP